MAELNDLLNDTGKNMPDDFLTVKEVAAYLKVSDNSVYNYLNQGLLNGVKVGRSWRISRGSIKEYLAKNTIMQSIRKGES